MIMFRLTMSVLTKNQIAGCFCHSLKAINGFQRVTWMRIACLQKYLETEFFPSDIDTE